MTNTEQQIDQLRRRLGWEAGGSLTQISTRATDRLASIAGSALNWVRRSGEEHPLVSILLAFQAGFALGRWGGWYAQR